MGIELELARQHAQPALEDRLLMWPQDHLRIVRLKERSQPTIRVAVGKPDQKRSEPGIAWLAARRVVQVSFGGVLREGRETDSNVVEILGIYVELRQEALPKERES